MTTFERLYIADPAAHREIKDPYYKHIAALDTAERILREFGLAGAGCHIVNGHVPVRAIEGESPIKGGGRLIIIDGGFCRAYQPTTGIAGYTLIYNSYGIRISSHEPFGGVENAIRNNKDILSTAVVFETMEDRIKISDTDVGIQIRENIGDLKLLLTAYRTGLIKERHKINTDKM